MGKKDARIDAYIDRSADFAKPILKHIRKLVHAGCPEVEETLKWGHPSFVHKGILCGMAAFKNHCAFILWKGALILDDRGTRVDGGMGHFGKLSKLGDLPKDGVMLGYIRRGAQLNEQGIKVPGKVRSKEKKELKVPSYFLKALRRNTKAFETFRGFSYTNKKDYVEWITEAKTEETRSNRLATAIEWMADGRARNWKYERK